MTMPPPHGPLSCDEAKRLLPLYVDRECSPDDARVVADHLVGCEPCAEEAAAARALRSTLREACREASAPAALRERVRASLHVAARRSRRRAPWIASAVAASIVGVVVFAPKEVDSPEPRRGRAEQPSRVSRPTTTPASATVTAAPTPTLSGPSLRHLPAPPHTSFPLVRASARSGAVSPVALTAPSAEPPRHASVSLARHSEEIARRHERPSALDIASPDLLSVSRYLQRRLSFPLRLPPIAQRGGQLLGARVADLTLARAAHLLFHKEGRKVSLFVSPRDESDSVRPGFALRQAGDINVVHWERGDLRYSLASDLGAHEMIRLAGAVSDFE